MFFLLQTLYILEESVLIGCFFFCLSTKRFKTFITTSPEGRTARTEVRQQLKKRFGQTCQYNTVYYINKFLFDISNTGVGNEDCLNCV
jgi:hypothetical protein